LKERNSRRSVYGMGVRVLELENAEKRLN